jgi:hypothetical protein
MTGPTPAEKLVEEVARAICKSRGINPDFCVGGSGGTGQPIVGHVRAWQKHTGQATAAIAVIIREEAGTAQGDGALAVLSAIRSLSKDQEHD